MSGYIIVVHPGESGYTSETYPVDGEGLLSVIALLEDGTEKITVLVIARSLNIRKTPVGQVTGSVPQ